MSLSWMEVSVHKAGWKLYFFIYIGLTIFPELYDQFVTRSELELSALRIAYAAVFATPVLVYSFTENALPHSVAALLFYVLIGLYLFGLMGVPFDNFEAFVVLFVTALHLPGVVILHRFKSKQLTAVDNCASAHGPKAYAH